MLRIPHGSVTGLLGLNGAGKSTTLKMLMGLLEPTRGSSHILGHDSIALTPEVRSRIGYTVEGHFLYGWMTVRQSETFQKQTFPRWDATVFADTIDRFNVDAGQKIRTLSRGQRAGVSIALTLSTSPEILVLDDPSLGLDPVSRRALNETLIDFCDGGRRTVLLSSHQLDDIERVADRLALMVHGQLLVDTTLEDFRSRVAAWSIQVAPASRALEGIPGLIHSRRLAGRTIVTVADPDQETMAAIERISEDTPEEATVNFEDAVISYLSRHRNEKSFLSTAGV
jgi:ABC-2 type transport system ATP-binding protein